MSRVRWLHAREEHLGRRGVAVFLEEVVLDLPHHVEADAVGQLNLLERVLHKAVLGVGLPGPRQLMLVEDPELHAAPSEWNSVRMSAPSLCWAHQNSTSARAPRRPSSRTGPRLWARSGSQIPLIISVPA